MQIRYFLALSLLPNLVSAQEPTDTEAVELHCVINPPVSSSIDERQQVPNLSAEDIVIISDRSEAAMGDKAHFSGNVSFSQGTRHISADEAILDQKNEQLDANGNLIFSDEMFTVTADSLNAQMVSSSATLNGAQYWLHGQQIHGDAEQLKVTEQNNLELRNTNFTTCPVGDNSWLLEAEEIRIDSTEEWGEIWDAKIRIAGVPVMYVPYMTIPVSDKRKSGFLFPDFSTSTTNGVEVSTPYYWNISPEYDLTFTPTYMSARGFYSKTEFRYLAGEDQEGQFNLEYLANDDKLDNSPDRYLYHWRHQGSINENWRVQANFTDVSDNNYFNDLSSDVNRSTDNQLSRVGEINYFEKDWDFGMKVQDIKVLGEDEVPYQVMPQLNFNYQTNDFWEGLDFKFNSELTNFQHKENEYSTATRFHMEPSITLPIQGPAGSLTSEIKLLQTQYWQNNIASDSELEDTVSRTIPQARLHGQINFERETHMFDADFRQTLEPQFQYLYVGYEDQDGIGIYDSAKLQEDYFGLFRDRRYSGLDRIADANQMTLGLTTRLFDDANIEKLKVSIGQIIYFQDSRINFADENVEVSPSTSVLAAEVDANLYQDWFISGAVQFDSEQGETKKSEVTLDFRPSNDKLLQFSYRYVPDLLNTNTNDRVDISQVGMRTSWPISDDLYFVGNFYYDLNESRSIETYTGVQYEACCWAMRLSYHYRIKTNYDDDLNPSIDTREQFESGVYLNFIIKGLGGSGPLGVEDMLNEGLFNYRKPLYLSN
ncbi:LPS assembly protein LptD [Shewanella sp. 1_MG-2023]|uniref:LPS assembly protein LptD n=1 Tax=unclassified Shewanella TaxID=196818 RepID=UPI0026E24A16|nr:MULTISPECIES: LPS assembly protein LptD [unclassified Shewanella]MDO6609893.1 LPS assembly protein LptD [Shewanella sp. 7_MG-2023]MDO6769965.1 LPS assembly protein LptD [Shewanella sp. 2_MG-2023]MDO6793029.1 LPS assembly protein LptD [Shewanella sp. 1_MG-2023]